jgi:hypothetical protein
MRTVLATSGCLLALVLSAPAAHAGSYIGLGIGSEAPLTGDLGDRFATTDTRHGRLVLGKRFGQLAIEGSLYGTEFTGPSGAGDFNTLSLGVDLKYHFGLAASFSAYLKGGLHKTWLQSGDDDPRVDSYRGGGHALGAGLQYDFAIAALWLDYNRQSIELSSADGRADMNGGAKLLTLGLSLSF